MGFKLNDISQLHWHNLVKNPDDLPKAEYPTNCLCMLAYEEDLNKENGIVSAFTICECVYFPSEKEWLSYMDERIDPNNPNMEIENIFHAEYFDADQIKNQKFMVRKPGSKVLMWCNPGQDYAMDAHIK